jgi:membrane protease YdiL (CAAX protease family)
LQGTAPDAKSPFDSGATVALLWVIFSAPVVYLLLHSRLGGLGALLGYELGCVAAARMLGVTWGRVPAVRELLLWAGITLALLSLALVVLPFLSEALAAGAPVMKAWGLDGRLGNLALLWYVLANPWIEEAFWRGSLLTSRFQSLIGRAPALLIATVGFVPYHVVVLQTMFGSTAWWLALPILLGSATWVTITLWRHSLYPAVITHLIADLFLVLIYLFTR